MTGALRFCIAAGDRELSHSCSSGLQPYGSGWAFVHTETATGAFLFVDACFSVEHADSLHGADVRKTRGLLKTLFPFKDPYRARLLCLRFLCLRFLCLRFLCLRPYRARRRNPCSGP